MSCDLSEVKINTCISASSKPNRRLRNVLQHSYKVCLCLTHCKVLCLLYQCDELEYLRPNVYRNVARQLNITIASESIVSDAFLAVAAEIFSTGVTWGKIVSLYAVAGALAVDCVRHGHPAMVHTIVDCMGEFVRKSLVSWLKRRGGWADITKCVVNTDPSFRSHWLVAAACACGHYLKAVVFYLLREK
uniref:BCL2 family apoptosis regulator BOK a n=1 Tax=Cyprinus carpio TaxID=7962 RepID=A0A8C2GQH9_CYPCA